MSSENKFCNFETPKKQSKLNFETPKISIANANTILNISCEFETPKNFDHQKIDTPNAPKKEYKSFDMKKDNQILKLKYTKNEYNTDFKKSPIAKTFQKK